MKKYEAYKDSGIEWIGMIPEGWSIERIKFQCNVTDGTHFSPQTADEGKPYVTVANVNNNKIDVKGALLISLADFETLVKQGCQPAIGDVLLAKDGTVGRSAVVEDNNDFVCLSSLGILHPNDGLVSKFLKYTLDSSILQDQMSQAMAGSALRRITIAKIKEFIFLLPEKAEQQAIADYLDYKVGQIDTSVAGINTQIEDLKAYRQAVISEAVTKGLNPDAPMKDSRIEWIGMIPEDWQVMKIKHFLECSKDGIKIGPFGSSLTGKVDDEGEYKVYGQWNIVGKNFSAGKNYVNAETYSSLENYKVIPGDILVSMMGTVGKCAIIPEDIAPGIMDSHVVKVRLDREKILPSFFEYVYDKDNSNVVYSQIAKYRRGSIMDGLNSSLIKDFVFPYPPLAEQQAIADYLDEKTSKIDTAIKSLENQRDDLNALRQTVISEAVTGKIDLRDWKK